MRTSYLPKKLVVSLFLFLAALLLLFACTANRRDAIAGENQINTEVSSALNLNTAGAAELEALPNIGPALAQKIIEHRTRYGPFRRPEDILIVEGISEKRFADLRKFIKTE